MVWGWVFLGCPLVLCVRTTRTMGRMETTTTTTTPPAPRFSAIERRILAANGGRPIVAGDLIPLRDARRAYARSRAAVGLTPKPGQWVTTGEESTKLGKNADATVGVTFSPGDEPARMLAAIVEQGWRPTITGRVLTPDLTLLSDLLPLARRLTVCPWSTPGCRRGCVIVTAGKGPTPTAVIGRLARWHLLVTDPLAAVTLTRHGIVETITHAGENHRWRAGVADDVRWELVAPCLMDPVATPAGPVEVKAYAYTKAMPDVRPETPTGPRITYSATGEGRRWTPASIEHAVTVRGLRVAAALRVKRGADLPDTYGTAPVIDGDEDDDRYATPRGVLVGLRAKGDAIRDTTGFVFAV